MWVKLGLNFSSKPDQIWEEACFILRPNPTWAWYSNWSQFFVSQSYHSSSLPGYTSYRYDTNLYDTDTKQTHEKRRSTIFEMVCWWGGGGFVQHNMAGDWTDLKGKVFINKMSTARGPPPTQAAAHICFYTITSTNIYPTISPFVWWSIHLFFHLTPAHASLCNK